MTRLVRVVDGIAFGSYAVRLTDEVLDGKPIGFVDHETRTTDEPARWVSWCHDCLGTTAIASRRRDVVEPLTQHWLLEHR